MSEAAPPPVSPDAPLRVHAWPVDGGHVLHVEEWGAADGLPALVLHGGPGSGCGPLLRRGFDLSRFRVICPDQRGSGRSTPRGATAHNTTAALLADLALVRERLGLRPWLVVGGSWGATLALAHALHAPQAVAGLLLRNPFLARREDVDAFFRGAPPPLAQGWHRLPESDADAGRALALAWWRWERLRSGLGDDGPEPDDQALAALADRYRVQAHYLRADCWLQAPPLLARLQALPRVPVLVLQGAEDAVCPPEGARALQAAVPWSRLELLPGVGHDPAQPPMQQALARALDAWATHGAFRREPPP